MSTAAPLRAESDSHLKSSRRLERSWDQIFSCSIVWARLTVRDKALQSASRKPSPKDSSGLEST